MTFVCISFGNNGNQTYYYIHTYTSMHEIYKRKPGDQLNRHLGRHHGSHGNPPYWSNVVIRALGVHVDLYSTQCVAGIPATIEQLSGRVFASVN